MKVVSHVTEPTTLHSATALLIDHDLAELIARIEALRLPADTRATKLRVGSVELDLIERTARRGDRSIDLRPREFQLLEYMMRRPDQILTREVLLREVWRYRFVPETNRVDVHMGQLRRKIDGPHELPMIQTIRGVGFILRAGLIKAHIEKLRNDHRFRRGKLVD